MSAKELIIEFVNLVFAILIIGFFIIYFIAGDRFEAMAEIMRMISPLAIFLLIFMIKMRMSRKEIKVKEEEKETEYIIYFSLLDKMKIEAMVYFLPALILLPPFMILDLDKMDIFQAIMAFLVGIYLLKFIFNRSRV
jgi:hypothetical protein